MAIINASGTTLGDFISAKNGLPKKTDKLNFTVLPKNPTDPAGSFVDSVPLVDFNAAANKAYFTAVKGAGFKVEVVAKTTSFADYTAARIATKAATDTSLVVVINKPLGVDFVTVNAADYIKGSGQTAVASAKYVDALHAANLSAKVLTANSTEAAFNAAKASIGADDITAGDVVVIKPSTGTPTKPVFITLAHDVLAGKADYISHLEASNYRLTVQIAAGGDKIISLAEFQTALANADAVWTDMSKVQFSVAANNKALASTPPIALTAAEFVQYKDSFVKLALANN